MATTITPTPPVSASASASASVALKMTFILNCLDDGWKVSKKENNYIFTKKHQNRREVFEDNYLDTFLEKGVCCNKHNCCNCIFEVDITLMPDGDSHAGDRDTNTDTDTNNIYMRRQY